MAKQAQVVIASAKLALQRDEVSKALAILKQVKLVVWILFVNLFFANVLTVCYTTLYWSMLKSIVRGFTEGIMRFLTGSSREHILYQGKGDYGRHLHQSLA